MFRSNIKDAVLTDISLLNNINFAASLDYEVVKAIFRKRNTATGKQYRIADLFGKDEIFYMALLSNGVVSYYGGTFHFNFTPVKVNENLLGTIFPRGFPKTPKQTNVWLSYIGWLAHSKFAN